MTYLLYSAAAQSLVQLLHDSVDGELMIQFVQTFLLESNATAVRWQVHELLYNMHKYVHVLSVLYCFKSFLATERVHILFFIFLIINATTTPLPRSKVQDITFLLAFSKLCLLLWRVCIFLVAFFWFLELPLGFSLVGLQGCWSFEFIGALRGVSKRLLCYSYTYLRSNLVFLFNLNLLGTQLTTSKWSYPRCCGKSGHIYQTMADERLSLLIFWATFRSSVNQALMRYLPQTNKVFVRWYYKRWRLSLSNIS